MTKKLSYTQELTFHDRKMDYVDDKIMVICDTDENTSNDPPLLALELMCDSDNEDDDESTQFVFH